MENQALWKQYSHHDSYIPSVTEADIACSYKFSPVWLQQEPLFAARVIYDLLFFFMVIIIVLNLIFGVIIDTFADLRSEKQKKEEILKTTCFICGEAFSVLSCMVALQN